MPESTHSADPTLAAHDRAVFQTQLPLPGRRQGKVRDVYRLPVETGQSPRLLVVASDRISAFDVVMPTPIPGKGRLLTDISLSWFTRIRNARLLADHLLGTDVSGIGGLSTEQRAQLAGRSMICRSARVVPIECVARGYLAGSGWVEYQQHGTVCGVPLPRGLTQCQQLPEPIFTPATKAESGHDENISFEQAADAVGGALMERLRQFTLELYKLAAAHARSCGVILADTKFEFGHALGTDDQPTRELLLIDEVLTPDSSRYWPLEGYAPGRDQPSFDKQYLRNWLLEEVAAGRWRKEPPGPELPDAIVRSTLERYQEAARLLS
jgi:phosphoribosylaminoimidazole-succinocarboxamide synthase